MSFFNHVWRQTVSLPDMLVLVRQNSNHRETGSSIIHSVVFSKNIPLQSLSGIFCQESVYDKFSETHLPHGDNMRFVQAHIAFRLKHIDLLSSCLFYTHICSPLYSSLNIMLFLLAHSLCHKLIRTFSDTFLQGFMWQLASQWLQAVQQGSCSSVFYQQSALTLTGRCSAGWCYFAVKQ